MASTIQLSDALTNARDLLKQYGDQHVSARLDDLIGSLNNCGPAAIHTALGEATGSMGSLNDRWISQTNGDAIRMEDEARVNDQLNKIVREIERCARIALDEEG